MLTGITKLISSVFKGKNNKNHNNTTNNIINLTKEIYVPNRELEAILGVKTFDDNSKIRENLTDAEIERAIVLYLTEHLTVNNYADLYIKYVDSLTVKCPDYNDLFPVDVLKNLYTDATKAVNLDKCLAEYDEKYTTREQKMATLRTVHSLPALITYVHANEYKLAAMQKMHNRVNEMASGK